jgi:hypothetical protein
MRDEFGDIANFLVVYVREAHACDEWEMDSNTKAGVRIPQPRSLEERRDAAMQFVGMSKATLPVVVDGLDDAASIPYGAWPERLYVLDGDGRVLYRGGPGPFEFKPEEVVEVLRRLRGR